MLDVEKFVDGLHDYIGRALRPIAIRLDALEKRQPEKGDPGEQGLPGVKGDPGEDGQDADYLQIQEMVNKAVANIPAPKDGKDGCDGKDGKDAEPVDINLIVADVLKAVPAPKDGIDGKDGSDGKNGKDAEPIDYEHVIAEAVKQIPMPKDGLNGSDGKDGKDGSDGRDADQQAILAEVTHKALQAVAEIPRPTDGRDGIDGQSVTLDDVRPMLESELSKWALDFERRAAGVLERAVERMPKPKDGENGKDGSDGLGFDDFDVEYDGERTFTFKWVKGEREKSKTFKAPLHIYQGVFKKTGQSYNKGDSVTYGGSLWIAMQDNPDHDPGNGQAWKLAVKKGSDAK